MNASADCTRPRRTPLAFAPHGRSYASGGEDGYVRITHFPEDYFDAFSKKSAEAFGRPWPEKK